MRRSPPLFLLAILSSGAAVAAPASNGLPLATAQDQGLTLEQAMDQAEAHSFTARIAGHSADEAEERAGEARGRLGPKLAVQANDAWISKKVNTLTGEQILTQRIPARVENASLVATQPLVGLGALALKLRADSLAADAARQDAAQSRADARLAGADAYIRALKAERFYAIAEASLAVIQKQRDDAAAMERSGKLSRVDVMRLDFSLSDTQTQLIQARSAVDVAALGLIETLGLARDTPTITLKTSPESTVEGRKLPLPDLASEQGKASDGRADLHSAAKRIEAAEATHSAAVFDYLPEINGFASYSRDFTMIDTKVPPIPGLLPDGVDYSSKDTRDNLMVGVALNWTLWDWGTRSRRRGELAAGIEKAKESEAALASRVHVEVAQAHAELRYAQQALESSKSSLRLAEEVYRATELKFKNGLATTTDLISAERDQTRARATAANAQGDVDLAWLKLKKAAGEKVAI